MDGIRTLRRVADGGIYQTSALQALRDVESGLAVYADAREPEAVEAAAIRPPVRPSGPRPALRRPAGEPEAERSEPDSEDGA